MSGLLSGGGGLVFLAEGRPFRHADEVEELLGLAGREVLDVDASQPAEGGQRSEGGLGQHSGGVDGDGEPELLQPLDGLIGGQAADDEVEQQRRVDLGGDLLDLRGALGASTNRMSAPAAA